MGEEIVALGTLASLPSLVASLPQEAAYLLRERAPTTWVDESARDELLRFERVTDPSALAAPEVGRDQGRLFNTDYEVRWDEHDDRVVYIGTQRDLHDALHNLSVVPLALNEPRDRSYSLWGTYLRDAGRLAGVPAGVAVYAEARLPRPLRYPDPPLTTPRTPYRLRLEVREYLDTATGCMTLVRFRDVARQTRAYAYKMRKGRSQ